MPQRVDRRRRLTDELIALGLALIVSAPLLLGRTYYRDDAAGLGLPLFAALQRALAAGGPLTWNPALFAGYNGLGAGQSGSYYPLNWLLLRYCPLLLAFRLSYVLHFWLLARGMVGCARALGATTLGALVTAAVATLGGATAAHTMHHNVIVGMAWSGPILWLTVLTVQQADARLPLLLLGAAIGLSLLQSHPQYVWLSLAAAAAVAIGARHRELSARRVTARLLGAVLLGGLLALPQTLPLLEYSGVYSRPQPGGPWSFLTVASFGWHEWLRLAQPELYGSPWRGNWTAPGYEYWETRGFCALTFTALALARVFAGRSNGATRAGLWLLAVAVLLLPGRHNPLYLVLIHVPPFSLFRAPGRHVWLLQLGLALLAGRGLMGLQEPWLTRRSTTLAAGVVGVWCLAAAWSVGPDHLLAQVGLPNLVAWALGLGLVLALPAATRLSPARRHRAVKLVTAVGLIELAVSWYAFADTVPQHRLATPPDLARPIRASAQRRLLDLRVPAPGGGPTAEIDQLVSNVGLVWGLDYLSGGREALPPVGHLGVLAELGETQLHQPSRFQYLLDRNSVRWLVTSQRTDRPDLRVVDRVGGAWLYENLTARPLAYALPLATSSERGVTTDMTNWRNWSPVQVVHQEAERWVLQTDLAQPMMVVLSQSLYPGWLAIVDGRFTPITGAELLYLAAPVPAGRHEVEFRFDNASIWLGRQLGLVAWLAWLVATGALGWQVVRPTPATRRHG